MASTFDGPTGTVPQSVEVEGLPLHRVIDTTKTDPNDVYGSISYQDDEYVVRSRRKDGELIISVHVKINGKEAIPRGYLLGCNMLIMGNKNA